MPQAKRQAKIEQTLTRPLTKSRFKIACECPTKLYYNAHPEKYANQKSEDSFLKNLARGGFQVGALAKTYFATGTEITTLDYDDSLEQTAALLQEKSVVIFEAAFAFENLFIRADIVEKDGDTLRLYEVKAKSYHPDNDTFWQKRKTDHLDSGWKEYLYDVAFQHYVVQKAFPHLMVVPYLYLANKAAVATVDGLNQRFRLIQDNGRERVITDKSLTQKELGEKILKQVDVSREVSAIQLGKPNGNEPPDWPATFSFSEWVTYLSSEYLRDEKIQPKVTGECKGCEFRTESESTTNLKNGFEECWTQALSLKPGTFHLRKPIFEVWKLIAAPLLKEGTYFIDQLSEEDLVPKTKSKKEQRPGLDTSQRKILQWQRTLTENPQPFFDKSGFLNEVKDYIYPLHFIDFETTTVAIPFNKGRRPYEQIAFQFSHHTLDKNGNIAHAGEWINTQPGIFPNFDFVRALRKQLGGDNGTVFRYAAHENTVLCQIRDQLLKVTSEEVIDRDDLVAWIETLTTPSDKSKDQWEPIRPMVDMLDLVLRYFWHPRMRGSNSIKVVLPAILEGSQYLREKYSAPIYGAKAGIKSTNYIDFAWTKLENGIPTDPYHLLPPLFKDWDMQKLDRLYGDEELADGGAAMMAYAKMQFSEMSKMERQEVTKALLRYCELDTLAMVMLWEGWMNWP